MNYIYNIPKLEFEGEQRYMERYWFIIRQNPKTLTELKQAIKWSIIDANITYDECVYNDKIMDIVKRLHFDIC